MKKQSVMSPLMIVSFCMIMVFGILPMSVFAAKENFMSCDHIGILNCMAPVAGENPDFDVDEYGVGVYHI